MRTAPLLAVGRALLVGRSPLVSNVRSSSAYKSSTPFKRPHLDELPVPQGSWQALYDSQQKKYNIQLVVGILFFSSAIGFIATTDRIFFNFSPPPLPEDE